MRTIGGSLRVAVTVAAWLSASGCASTTEPAGSSKSPLVENPTGSCSAPDDGSRAGYHSAGGDSVWVLDCQNPLLREYWRVFARSQESAYVMPRPDGEPRLTSICNDGLHELYALVDNYGLCHPAGSTAEVDRVNNMVVSDALKITHFLHTQLRFEVGGGLGISPFPIPSDILDACVLDANSSDLQQICDRERDRAESGQDIGFDYTGPGAIELVARLNELYGIP